MALFLTALRSLIERPLRTLLTMLGIVIGVAAVYTMLAIGEGTKAKILESIDSVQARTISVYPNWGRGRSSNAKPWRPFSEADVAEIRALPGVFASTGNLDRNFSLVNSAIDWDASVKGGDIDFMKAGEVTLLEGRALNQSDIDTKATVVVLGASVTKTMYGNRYPIGETLKIGSIPFTVIGTVDKLDESGWSGGQDRDNFVLIPRSTARDRLIGDNNLTRNQVRGISVVGHTQKDLKSIEEGIDFILRRSRRLSAAEPPDYRVLNFSANRQQYAKTQKTLSLLLATMGIVSLVVGGVGVMNIMLVSVTERTREIGLRMSLGARKSDILSQFLTEALLICILSGLIGLGVGFGISKVGLGSEDIEMVFSPDIALLAFGSALLVGVVFGFLPARRASRLNPVEALRHE